MGKIVYQHETGAAELLAKTVRAWIQREWAGTLPKTAKTPDFVDPTKRKNKTAWPKSKAKAAVYFNMGQKVRMGGSTSDARSVVVERRDIRIDCFAPSVVDLDQFNEKINNIIIEHTPNSGTRIRKSNDKDLSRIVMFREHSVDWSDPFVEGSGVAMSMHNFGYLGCIYQKQLSA